jgi:hypothetical protein
MFTIEHEKIPAKAVLKIRRDGDIKKKVFNINRDVVAAHEMCTRKRDSLVLVQQHPFGWLQLVNLHAAHLRSR